jgi:hypothetical protein
MAQHALSRKNQGFTMKRALIGGLLFAVLASSAPAFAQSSSAAPRTRADVKAELIAARNSGELDLIHSESYPQLLPYQTSRNARATSNNDTAVTQVNSARISTQ